MGEPEKKSNFGAEVTMSGNKPSLIDYMLSNIERMSKENENVIIFPIERRQNDIEKNNKKDPKRVREILYPVRKESDNDDPDPVAV